MTTRLYSSISQETTLAAALNSSATTMTVVNASGLLATITPASPAGSETFVVVIDPDTALEEIVEVVYPSAPGSNTLTIQRNIDSSTAQAHSAGAAVRHMAIGRDFRDADSHIRNTTTAHGLTIANVISTTDTGASAKITSGMIINGAIATEDIADSAITSAKIAAASVTSDKIVDGTISTIDIADSAITSGKIATGAVGTTKIDDLSITEAKIAPNAVTTGKIADSAITSAKIADGTIVAGDIANGAITSAKILDGTIATGDIADGAITSAKIADGTIVADDLADGAVTSAKILDGTIVNADINAGAAIAKTKLDLGGTITSADLVDGTIVNADINASAGIALSKLATDPLARANHTGTQTASTISDFDTQVRTNRLDQMTAPTGSVSLNNQKITNLATPTSSGDAVSLGYITGQKGIANGIAELDGNGLVPTHHLPALAISETSVVNSQANMLALTAQVGDVAVRTDVNKSFILTATPASTLGNWQELLTPTDAVLSVDGSTGAVSLSGTYVNRTSGQLLGNLDANNFKVTGLGTPTSNADAATKAYVDTVAGSATAAAASAAAAATTYDNFDDRYLGAKISPPSVDNDGNALIIGAIYWDSTANAMFAWSGSAWGSISSTAAIYRYRYTAVGGETSISGLDDNGLTLSYLSGKEQVYLNGVLLVRTTDYNATNGTSITGLAALTAGDILEIITFTSFELATAIQQSIFDAKGDLLAGTGADTVGKLTVGTNGTVLMADSSTATGLKWSAYDPLPSQTGNTGEFLTTDGSTTSWAAVSQVPSQTGQTGKYLTTDGSTASWASVTTDPTPTTFLLMGA
jgi:hypothetical protein